MWPIHLINLDRSRSRLDASRALFDGAGLAFQRFPAVDCLDLTAFDMARLASQNPPMFAKSKVSAPEFACFLSHIGVWRKISAGPSPVAFVFEDDFDLQPGAVHAMNLLSGIRPGWDMLKLYAPKDRAMIGSVVSCGSHQIGVPAVLPSTTVAYAITRNAARELSERCFPLRRPVDLYLKHWWEHEALIKVIQPSLVAPAETHIATSSIDAARVDARRSNIVSRLFRNLTYQAAFRFNMIAHAKSRRVDATWPVADQVVISAAPRRALRAALN